MEFKGTKGKWVTDYHCTDRQFINISSEEKGIVARSFYGDIEPILDQEECKANALLISKSPEMLEMLKLTLELWGSDSYLGSHHYDKIKQLIKEATTL